MVYFYKNKNEILPKFRNVKNTASNENEIDKLWTDVQKKTKKKKETAK